MFDDVKTYEVVVSDVGKTRKFFIPATNIETAKGDALKECPQGKVICAYPESNEFH